MERATGTEVYGCGTPQTSDITLKIQTTTGGNFSISVNGKNTVEHLKKIVSKKLKVSKDRICLLHRERQLREGTLEENGLLDGSRVMLLPSVETGLLSQRPENSVMQALESLNDTQVNDFLSGKSPLNLTMRLGDHMMLIQLQLSTLNSSSIGGSRSLRTSTPAKSSSTSTQPKDTKEPVIPLIQHKTSEIDAIFENARNKVGTDCTKPIFGKRDLELIQNAFDLYKSMAAKKYNTQWEYSEENEESMDTTNSSVSDMSSSSTESEQSPIKSLSNLVSSPIDASTSESCDAALVNSVKSNLIDLLSQSKLSDVIPSTSAISDQPCPSTSSLTPDSTLSDDSDNFADQSSFLAESTIDEYPMENLFNSAVDKGLFEEQDESMMDREISNLATTSHGAQETTTGTLPSFQSINEPLKNKRFQYLLHKTSKFKHPIGQNKQKAFMQSVVNKHKKRMQIRQDSSLAQPSTSTADPYITNSRKLILQPSSGQQATDNPTPSTSKQEVFKTPDAPKKPHRSSPVSLVDTRTLIEASKNLTQKLKKLSKEVLTNKMDLRTAEEAVRSKIGPGAVIESMKHHGKGIYSGTFSGTLNPALQDRYGRPKRDISTIIHILNDLLCAAPPMSRAQKETKHSCSTGEARKCLGCSQPACAYGQCDGHAAGTSGAAGSGAAAAVPAGAGATCATCAGPMPAVMCNACATGPISEDCAKCNTARTLAIENSKTKCKLEQLRLVMQQKKQRREARRLKTLPYVAA